MPPRHWSRTTHADWTTPERSTPTWTTTHGEGADGGWRFGLRTEHQFEMGARGLREWGIGGGTCLLGGW
ncbi:hypothetical protein TcasGA2_TC031389 [Tribolium castaneum]|uniref:Uncharacterized protein n=1 Tax=Tribolium castaneum TaxID=7070 RepID=A0A139WAC2_TRICA|nr:hypothetical protein TcasGA2_TC031389 [Tribolium castaneum]